MTRWSKAWTCEHTNPAIRRIWRQKLDLLLDIGKASVHSFLFVISLWDDSWTNSEQAFGHLHWFFLCFYLACHLVANQCKAKLNNDGAEIGSEISLRCGVLLDWQLSGQRQPQKYQMKSACWSSHSNMQSLIFTFKFSGRLTSVHRNGPGILAGLRAQFPYSFLVHLKWFKVYRICP